MEELPQIAANRAEYLIASQFVHSAWKTPFWFVFHAILVADPRGNGASEV